MKQCLQLPSQTYSTTKRMKAKIEKKGLPENVCKKGKTIFMPQIFKAKQKQKYVRLSEIMKNNTECTQSSGNTKDSKIC